MPVLKVILQKHGCMIRTIGGALFYKPMLADGSISEEPWSEVTAPESQAFLDAVNRALGTSFKLSEFAGR